MDSELKIADEHYYRASVEQTARKLETDISGGLSKAEAERRLANYGYNEFEKRKKRSLAVKFAEQFKNFMIIVLIAAAVISGVVGYLDGEGFADAIIILAIVVLNAIIGVVQENKAEKSLEALEKMSAPFSKVRRSGLVEVVPARDLVPGDMVILDTGDLVPADMRLTQAVNLKAQEASLTGESVPTEKTSNALEGDMPLGDRLNMAYSSTLITYGRGEGIVVATGMNTEVGKIAGMIQSVPETKTPLQARIDKLGKFLAYAALCICILIFIVGMVQGRGVMAMLMTAVSLAAAAIPEGLPAVSTIVLAIGVQRLAKRHAIVRNLPSVETLGSTTVICSDKTGTLTQNRMTVVELFVNNKTKQMPDGKLDDAENLLLRCFMLPNDGKLSVEGNESKTAGDPTETAFIDMGLRYGVNKNDLDRDIERVAEVPFDSDRKMMSTVNRDSDGTITVYVKGGVDEVLSCCDRIVIDGGVRDITDADRKSIDEANSSMAERALRVLAAAYKEADGVPSDISPEGVEHSLVFAGMAGMIDPAREEVNAAVATCRTAGIKPVMITGDHKITATAIARMLDIAREGDSVITGSELESMSDDDLTKTVRTTSVFARVSPEHKVRIVRAFKTNGEVVAMTGDGVNDAPALKLADIGVAMGITGTDVSKEAADVVLTNDNFATIVVAVEEGRRIYDNILKAVQFLLSSNIGEIVVIFVAIVANWATPLLPIQILWINLVTDSLPALALSVDPAESNVMSRAPIDPQGGIINRPFIVRLILQGAMIGGLSLAAFLIGMESGDVEVAQTMTFAVLALAQLVHVFNVRSATRSAFRGMFNNRMLLLALLLVIIMMVIVFSVPALYSVFHVTHLDSTQWLWVGILTIAPLPIVEIVKAMARVVGKKNKSKH